MAPADGVYSTATANREEAARAREIALQKMEEKDWEAAKRIWLKAQRICPDLEGIASGIAVAEVHIVANKTLHISAYKEVSRDYYGILDVRPDVSRPALIQQYKKRAFQLHPDKNQTPGAEAAFKLLGEAWEILKDEQRRSKYDKQRAHRLATQNLARAGQRQAPPPQNAPGANPPNRGPYAQPFAQTFGGQTWLPNVFAGRGGLRGNFAQAQPQGRGIPPQATGYPVNGTVPTGRQQMPFGGQPQQQPGTPGQQSGTSAHPVGTQPGSSSAQPGGNRAQAGQPGAYVQQPGTNQRVPGQGSEPRVYVSQQGVPSNQPRFHVGQQGVGQPRVYTTQQGGQPRVVPGMAGATIRQQQGATAGQSRGSGQPGGIPSQPGQQRGYTEVYDAPTGQARAGASQPGAASVQPGLQNGRQRGSASQPGAPASQPRAYAGQQGVPASQPGVNATNPGPQASQPGASGAQQGGFVGQPGASGPFPVQQLDAQGFVLGATPPVPGQGVPANGATQRPPNPPPGRFVSKCTSCLQRYTFPLASKDQFVRCQKCRAAFMAREEEPPGVSAPGPPPAAPQPAPPRAQPPAPNPAPNPVAASTSAGVSAPAPVALQAERTRVEQAWAEAVKIRTDHTKERKREERRQRKQEKAEQEQALERLRAAKEADKQRKAEEKARRQKERDQRDQARVASQQVDQAIRTKVLAEGERIPLRPETRPITVESADVAGVNGLPKGVNGLGEGDGDSEDEPLMQRRARCEKAPERSADAKFRTPDSFSKRGENTEAAGKGERQPDSEDEPLQKANSGNALNKPAGKEEAKRARGLENGASGGVRNEFARRQDAGGVIGEGGSPGQGSEDEPIMRLAGEKRKARPGELEAADGGAGPGPLLRSGTGFWDGLGSALKGGKPAEMGLDAEESRKRRKVNVIDLTHSEEEASPERKETEAEAARRREKGKAKVDEGPGGEGGTGQTETETETEKETKVETRRGPVFAPDDPWEVLGGRAKRKVRRLADVLKVAKAVVDEAEILALEEARRGSQEPPFLLPARLAVSVKLPPEKNEVTQTAAGPKKEPASEEEGVSGLQKLTDQGAAPSETNVELPKPLDGKSTGLGGENSREAADRPGPSGANGHPPTEPYGANGNWATLDSIFFDFDEVRKETDVRPGDFWALYDEEDGMPRFYGRIDAVSANPFEVDLTWLEATEETRAAFVARQPPLGAHKLSPGVGEFRFGDTEKFDSINIFAYKQTAIEASEKGARLFPRCGEVWAMFQAEERGAKRDRDGEKKDQGGEKKPALRYEMVEIVGVDGGYTVAKLVRLPEHPTLFQPLLNTAGKRLKVTLGSGDVPLFSHRVLAKRVPRNLINNSGANQKAEVWELDPAGLPA